METTKGKIRGWLIWLSIGAMLAPLLQLFHLIYSYKQTSEWYLARPLFLVDLILLILLIIYTYCFFQKKKITPKLFIFIALYTVINTFSRPFMEASYFESELTRNDFALFVLVSLSSMIWITYYKVSERVKKTFIH
jgi:hypothetical protein